tara:strand:+ start:692 stop:928 length:237 start_codon:yes stop_codon:yes gene_type:complete
MIFEQMTPASQQDTKLLRERLATARAELRAAIKASIKDDRFDERDSIAAPFRNLIDQLWSEIVAIRVDERKRQTGIAD